MLTSNADSELVYFVNNEKVHKINNGCIITTNKLNLPSLPCENEKERDLNHSNSGNVLAVTVSPKGDIISFVNDKKFCFSFLTKDVHSTDDIVPSASHYLFRRASCLVFHPQTLDLFVGEKSGNVYCLKKDQEAVLNPHTEDECDDRVILGHVSMLTSICISSCGKFLATADRDEKIRISSLPHTYEIINFLLGHKKYVYGLEFSDELEILLSCGGDNCIIQWDFKSGKIIKKLHLSEILEDDLSKTLITNLKVVNKTALISIVNPHKLVLCPLSGAHSPVVIDIPYQPVDFCCFNYDRKTCSILLLTSFSDNNYEFFTCVLNLEDPTLNSKKDLFCSCSELNTALASEIPRPHPKMEFLDSLVKSAIDISGKEAYEKNKEQHHKSILERRQRHQRNREQKRRRENASGDESS